MDTFFLPNLQKMDGILKHNYFKTTNDEPCVLYFKSKVDHEWSTINLRNNKKPCCWENASPEEQFAPGLSQERVKYLYEQIRKHIVDEEIADYVCPKPNQRKTLSLEINTLDLLFVVVNLFLEKIWMDLFFFF